jgi:hypothetical protein
MGVRGHSQKSIRVRVMNTNLFNPGRILATPGALDLALLGTDLSRFLSRHLSGDWGDLCKEDKEENNFSLINGFRLLSAYETGEGRLWIITEADRSATTVLLPEEY